MSNTTTTTAETVTTAPATAKAAKASKAPKASPPKAAKPVIEGKVVIAYEPGIQTLKLGDIDTTVANVTRPEGLTADPELVESLTTLGQQTPVIVQRVTTPDAKHPYRLAAGYRRFTALKSMGKATVEARIEVTGTDEARVLVNVTENENARREISPLGRLAGYEALAALGHPVSKVASIVGRAEDFVRDTLRISNGADEIRTALALPEGEEGACTWGVARQVLRFSKAEQPTLLKRVSHLSVEAARSYLADYRASKKAEAEGDDESEETEGKASKKAVEEDATYPEARVVKATVPFFVDYNEAIGAVREAAMNLDAAGLEKAANALVRACNRQETALRQLIGEKAFEAALKAAVKAAKA